MHQLNNISFATFFLFLSRPTKKSYNKLITIYKKNDMLKFTKTQHKVRSGNERKIIGYYAYQAVSAKHLPLYINIFRLSRIK